MSVSTPQKNIGFAASIVDSSPEASGFENVQKEGYGLLLTTPFPSLRDEYWKYTRVSGLLKKEFKALKTEGVSLSESTLEMVGTNPRIVFVNGFINPDLSVIPSNHNVTVSCLSTDEITEDNVSAFPTTWENELEAFTLLNQSSFTDGALIEVNKNEEITESIYLIHLTTGENVSVSQRNYIKLNTGSKATFINVFEGDNELSFSNHFNSILVGEDANFNWFDYHQDGENAQSITTTIAHQEANSQVNIGAFIFGGKMIRKNLYTTVLGQNCETTVNGAYILDNKQVADYRVIVDHKAANCDSNQMFKGVMTDQSTGVFNGKIYVRKDSQLINAFQNNRNILLTDDANAYSRPQLEIYADDVKCSHGSTIGQLDNDALFYMMARGIRKTEAEKLLVSAFTADSLANINDELFKEMVFEAIANKSEKL